jgi:magnesium chelatase subunit D
VRGADNGAVTLQRDGLSCVLPTRFAIVALDEGAEPDERPPASLLDRMAFHIDLTEVSLRDVGNWRCVPSDVGHSRGNDRLDAVKSVCQAAMALGIDSPRVPLFALRAARVAAATCGRSQVTDADICLAARLVLAPRATRFPLPEDAEEPDDAEPHADSGSADLEEEPPDLSADQPLADVVLDAAKAALPSDLLARLALTDGGRGLTRASDRVGQFKMSTTRGRPIGTRQGDPKGGARSHLLETLKAAAP